MTELTYAWICFTVLLIAVSLLGGILAIIDPPYKIRAIGLYGGYTVFIVAVSLLCWSLGWLAWWTWANF